MSGRLHRVNNLKTRIVAGFIVGVVATSVGLALAQDSTPGGPEQSPPTDPDPAGEPAFHVANPAEEPARPAIEEDMQIGAGSEPVPQVEIDNCQQKLDQGGSNETETVYCQAILAIASGEEVPPGRYTTEEMNAVLNDDETSESGGE